MTLKQQDFDRLIEEVTILRKMMENMTEAQKIMNDTLQNILFEDEITEDIEEYDDYESE